MAGSDQSKPIRSVTHLGSYKLLEPLGSGGMSSVFRAVHEATGVIVAIKVLPRYLAKKESLLRRFQREAQSAEALQHPNIVSIFDRGSEDGRYYLVLEYVDGADLQVRIRDDGVLTIEDAIHVIKKTAEALQYAASQGVIHRDIKPANILIATDGTVKLIDLGLAMQSESEDERVTRDGTTVGTVDYMSPEQARDSRKATIKSDIYSLGCTFYFLLTGHPPFIGGHIADKLRRHAFQGPPDVRHLCPDAPGRLARLIQQMMAKSPDERFQDYESLLDALKQLQKNPVSAGPDSESGILSATLGAVEDADFVLDDDDADVTPGSTHEVRTIPPNSSNPVLPRETSDHRALTDGVPRKGDQPRSHDFDDALPDLAALVDDEDETAETVSSASIAARKSSKSPATEEVIREPFDPFADIGEDDYDSDPGAYPVIRSRRGRQSNSSGQAWAIGGALIGLLFALLGFAIVTLARMDWSAHISTEPSQEESSVSEPNGSG